MPRHPADQPLRRRGFTLPELVVGVAFLTVVGLALARMLLGLVNASQYTLRQTSVLAAGRRALINSGRLDGLVWKTEQAASFRALSTTTLTLAMYDATQVDFAISSRTLFQTVGGASSRQAVGLTGLRIDYYEIGSNGLIAASTVPAQASLATFTVSVTGKGKQKTYDFFSAAALRNR